MTVHYVGFLLAIGSADRVPIKLNLSGVQYAGAFNFRRPVTRKC